MSRLLWGKLIDEARLRRVGSTIGIFLLATSATLILRSDSTPIVDDGTAPPTEVISRPTNIGPLKVPVEEIKTFEEMFQEIGSQYDMDWHILEALAYYESRMDYLATGKSDEMGLMQIAPQPGMSGRPRLELMTLLTPTVIFRLGRLTWILSGVCVPTMDTRSRTACWSLTIGGQTGLTNSLKMGVRGNKSRQSGAIMLLILCRWRTLVR